MARTVQMVRQAAAQASSYLGADAQLIVDKGDYSIRVHDAVTPGGHKTVMSSGNLAELADKAQSRINLGVQIGVDVMAYSAVLANIASATGSGTVVVMQNTPTINSANLLTPNLGTPTAGNLANCTAYAVANLAGLGAGVATALGIAVGNAGAFVAFNGALGAPASGNLANCTGLPLAGVSGLAAGIATFLATPSSANLLAALTTKTGTGNVVFSANPAFTGTATFVDISASGNIVAGAALGGAACTISGTFTGDKMALGGRVLSGEVLGVQGNAVIVGDVRLAGGGSDLTVDGAATVQGNLTCANGNISSGNTVSATSFDVLVTLGGLNMIAAEIHGGATNYDIVARVNGVRLTDGATSWTSASSIDYKTDIEPIPGDPFEIIAGHRAVIGRYKNMPEDALRPFLLYEDAIVFYPMAAVFTPEVTRISSRTGETVIEPEHKGINYDHYIPLLMAAFQKQIAINEMLTARIEALEAG